MSTDPFYDKNQIKLRMKGVPDMTAKELNSYEIQTVKMCIQTHVNLYGCKPTIQELSLQLDPTYQHIVKMMLSENHIA